MPNDPYADLFAPTDLSVEIPGKPEGNISVRQNNATNLVYAGQPGAYRGAQGFAGFETPEAGIEAASRQLEKYKEKGYTLAQGAERWFRNPKTTQAEVDAYVKDIVKLSGFSPGTPMSQIPTSTLEDAFAKRESGATIKRGGDPYADLFTEAKPAAQEVGTILSPVKSGTLGGGYDDTRSHGPHHAGDIYPTEGAGAAVLAPVDLEVLSPFPGRGMDKNNMKVGDWGVELIDRNTGRIYSMIHMNDTSNLKQGQKFKAGEQIGTVGGVVDHPHLHMAVHKDGQPVNWLAEHNLARGTKLAGAIGAGSDPYADLFAPKAGPPESELKVGAKEGVLRVGQAGARAADPMVIAFMQAGLSYMPGLFGEYDNLPASSDQRVQSVTKTLMGELFPRGVPPEKQGYLDWIPRRLASMWPEFASIAALGPLGEVAAGAVDSAVLSHILGGAIPFGATGALMSEKGPVAGGLESAIFGGVLGAGKFATDFIPNALAKWTARIAGGFGLGAGAAAIEGADAEEIKKQGLLFALFEVFGIPRGKYAEAAGKVSNNFLDALTEIAERTEEARRQGHDVTVMPGTTRGILAGAPEGTLPMEAVTRVAAAEREGIIRTPQHWPDLTLDDYAKLRQLEIEKVEAAEAARGRQPWSETVGETEIRKAQEVQKLKAEEAAALQAKLDRLRSDYERDQMPGWKALPPEEVEAEVSDMIRRYRDGSDEPIMTEVAPPDVLEKVRAGENLPPDYERRIIRALTEGSFPEYGMRKQWEQYLEQQQRNIDNLATQTTWAGDEGVAPMYSIGPAPEAGPISNKQIMSARDEVAKRYDIPKTALAYKGTMRGKGNTALAMFDVVDPNNSRYRSTLSAKIEKAPIWYSKLEKAIDTKLPGKGTGQSLANIIQAWADKGEFKREELKWSGLIPWLQEREGIVTKQMVMDFLNSPEHRVEIEEVWKGGPEGVNYERFHELWEKEIGIASVDSLRSALNNPQQRADLRNTILDRAKTPDGRERLLLMIDAPAESVTKFSQYTLPGGENYREVLLRVPGAEGAKTQTDRLVDQIMAGGEPPAADNVFRSSHWEEPNVFSHVRVNDRRGPKGEKILFIEELQSDWALEGRRKGFKGEEPLEVREARAELARLVAERDRAVEADPRLQELKAQMNAASQEAIELKPAPGPGFKEGPGYEIYMQAEGRAYLARQRHNEIYNEVIKDYQRKIAEAAEKIPPTGRGEETGVPPFPFSRNWHEVALKRMLRYAAENGYDEIAWTTGEQQAERYDLSKYVNEVSSQQMRSTGNYVLNVWDKNDVPVPGIADKEYTAKELEGTVGKDLATKIIKYHEDNPNIGTRMPQSRFSGLDLKIGGEWAYNLYDRMIPSFLNKYGKQWGARVGETRVDAGYTGVAENLRAALDQQGFAPDISFEQFKRLTGYENAPSWMTNTMWEALKKGENTAGTAGENVHRLSLTPSLKQSVLYNGQPMFLASDGKPVKQIVSEGSVRDAFGGDVTVKRLPDGDFLALTSGGAAVRVHPNADIVIDPHQFAIAYQRPYAGEKGYAEWDPRKGRWENITYNGIINLAKEGFTGDLDHEVFHAAMDLALTPEEQRLVLDKYKSEEAAASAYSKWKPSEANTLFEKIRAFFSNLWRSFFPNAGTVFGRMKSGEVWERTPEGKMAEPPPMYKSGHTEDWETLKEAKPLGRPSERQRSAASRMLDSLRTMWAPETRTPEAMVSAQEFTKQITNARGEVLKASKVFYDFRSEWMKMSPEERWALSSKMERGEKIPAEWEPYARARKDAFDKTYDIIKNIRGGVMGFIENYAPHLYKDLQKAAVFFDTLGKKPIEGKKGFLKQRLIPDMETAIKEHGLEPLFDNPIQQDMAGLMEQWRYIAGNRFIDGLIKKDLFIPIDKATGRPSKTIPEGWIKTDPRVFRNGYAPREVIDLIHNHLVSEAGNLWYTKYKTIMGAWNAWHVTLSLFHGMTTFSNQIAMGFAKGIPDLLGAVITGDHVKMATALKRVGPMAVVDAFRWAREGKGDFYEPGRYGPRVRNVVQVVTDAGILPEHVGRDLLPSGTFKDHLKELAARVKGGEIGASMRAAIDTAGHPIMGYLVPTLKYGSTLMRVAREMDSLTERYNKQYGTNWTPEAEANFVKDLGSIAYNERQFSDNIFGEIHPDNLHWNRGLASWMKGIIAYPGWNIGTTRWLGGMIRGIGELATGKELDYQARISLQFGAGLMLTVGLANTILHMALNNGKEPEDWKDVLVGARTGKYLNNGQPERITIASYMKDIMALQMHIGREGAMGPYKYAKSKLMAPFTMIKELEDNADYFGTEIIPRKGNVLEKAAGFGKWLVGHAAPFGASGIATGKSTMTQYGGFFGFRPVPRYMTNTAAMNTIDEILYKQSPRMRTAEASENTRIMADLKEKGWAGQRDEMEAGLRDARQAGKLTPIQIQHIRQDINQDKRVVQFKKLRNIEDALEVYEKGNPDEKRLWRRILADKWSRASAEKKRRFRDDYLAAIAEPMAEQTPERIPPRPGFSILGGR